MIMGSVGAALPVFNATRVCVLRCPAGYPVGGDGCVHHVAWRCCWQFPRAPTVAAGPPHRQVGPPEPQVSHREPQCLPARWHLAARRRREAPPNQEARRNPAAQPVRCLRQPRLPWLTQAPVPTLEVKRPTAAAVKTEAAHMRHPHAASIQHPYIPAVRLRATR